MDEVSSSILEVSLFLIFFSIIGFGFSVLEFWRKVDGIAAI